MKQPPQDKLAKKRALLLARTAEALGISTEEALALLRTPRKQSLRRNPLIPHVGRPIPGTPCPWFKDGFFQDETTTLRDAEEVLQGAWFIQNAASWLPVLALQPQAGERILDVCAAPGGKTTHIAALTNNQAHLWANDNSRVRLAKLQATARRLGAAIERFTLYDATQLARKLEGEEFDKILLDAPCSGEGLMHYDRDKDFLMWSPAQIKRLQQLQKRILTQAWQLLKPGGTLVYSTCTMAPEENEAVVDYLVRSRPDACIVPIEISPGNQVDTVAHWNGRNFAPETRNALRLKPSSELEAFFVCKVVKERE